MSGLFYVKLQFLNLRVKNTLRLPRAFDRINSFALFLCISVTVSHAT